AASQAAVVLDSSIDWRHRLIWGRALFMNGAPEGTSSATAAAQIDGTYILGQIPMFIDYGGVVVQSFKAGGLTPSGATWKLAVSGAGVLSVAQVDAIAPVGDDNYA